MGLPIQSQEIRSQEIKSAVENKSEEKKVLNVVKMRSSLSRFHKKQFLFICILNIAMGFFNINYFAWL